MDYYLIRLQAWMEMGKSNHTANNCFFKDKKCANCDKMGLIKDKCKSKSKNYKDSRNRKNVRQIKSIFEKDNPIKEAEFMVGNKKIKFEIDTGAAISIISERHYKNFFSNKKIIKESFEARTVSREKIPNVGKIKISIEGKKLFLFIVKIPVKTPILGRDILDILDPDWRNKIQISGTVNQIKEISKFKDENSGIKGFKYFVTLKKTRYRFLLNRTKFPLQNSTK